MSCSLPFRKSLILLEAADSENGRNRKFMDVAVGKGREAELGAGERARLGSRRKERTGERKPRQEKGIREAENKERGVLRGKSLKKTDKLRRSTTPQHKTKIQTSLVV